MKQIKNKTGLRLAINKNWETISYARDAWKQLIQDELVTTIIKQTYKANAYRVSNIRYYSNMNNIVALYSTVPSKPLAKTEANTSENTQPIENIVKIK